MSLLFMHGIDGLTATDSIQGLFTVSTGLGISSNGRFGGLALNGGNFDQSYWEFDFADQTECILSMAFRPATTFHSTTDRREFLFFYKGGTQQFYLRAELNGRVRAYNGNNTLIAESANQVLFPNVYSWISCRVVFSTTVGVVEVEIDEQNIFGGTLTNQNTENGATGCNRFRVRGCSTADAHIDDIVLCNGAGTKLNGILKDRRIVELKPTADTATADFTRSGGTTNFENVDDTTQDGDSTYVESSTATHKDIYVIEDLPAEALSVDAVSIDCYARKDDAGSRSLDTIVESGGSEAPQTNTLQTTYAHKIHLEELDPQGGGNWTVARVNAMQIGQEVV